MHKPPFVRFRRLAPLLGSSLGLLLPSLFVAGQVSAQEPPPPPPPPPSEGGGYGWDVSAEASTDSGVRGESEVTTPASEPSAPSGREDATSSEAAPALAASLGEGAESDAEKYARFRRTEQLRAHNSLRASTGLLRVREAASGPVGSFRMALYGGLYSGSSFLCTESAPCPDRGTDTLRVGDDVDRAAANLTLSATPFPFLEAFFGVYNSSTSNSLGRPQLLQVLGDANVGVKLFKPTEADEIFSYGGEAELLLLNGTGGVGLDGKGTSFALRALGTLDLNNRTKEADRIPVRAHLNLGYVFDNSGQVIERLETTPPPTGRGQRIERIERFGLGISRVDTFQVGLGVEYLADLFRPFAEWTLDVPVNRQDYVCNIQGASRRGDLCLGSDGRLSTFPSRFSLGTRIYPWQNLAVTAALDLATGGSTRFLEETTPELPYTVWLGVAYAVDTQPAPVVQKVVQAERGRDPRRFAEGKVVDATSGEPVADAILRYEGVALTGMVADGAGAFRTTDLAPGEYVLAITAEGYKPGTCAVSIPSSAEDVPSAGAADADAAPRPTVDEAGNLIVPVECKVAPLPKVATITGVLVDATTGEPIGRATVKVTDKLGRELELTADDAGAFQFRNVPFGRATVTAGGAGYLTTVAHFEIDSRKDIEARLALNKRPEQSNVEVTDKEVKLKRQVHFLYDSAAILPDSLAILEEIAEALKAHPEITLIEIQGHTDTTGQAAYNRQLSQKRAEAVRASLIKLGVAEDRLVAKGYGPDKPLVPNSSDANRARNRRVQLIVLERSNGPSKW